MAETEIIRSEVNPRYYCAIRLIQEEHFVFFMSDESGAMTSTHMVRVYPTLVGARRQAKIWLKNRLPARKRERVA